jgi:hypothetical protein
MRINGLLAEWQKKVSGESSHNPLRVVELLGANPFITTKGVANKLAIRVYDRAARHRTIGTCAYRKTGGQGEARPSIARLRFWISSKSRPASSQLTTNNAAWSPNQERRSGSGAKHFRPFYDLRDGSFRKPIE